MTQDIDIQMSKNFVDNLVEILYRSFDGELSNPYPTARSDMILIRITYFEAPSLDITSVKN